MLSINFYSVRWNIDRVPRSGRQSVADDRTVSIFSLRNCDCTSDTTVAGVKASKKSRSENDGVASRLTHVPFRPVDSPKMAMPSHNSNRLRVGWSSDSTRSVHGLFFSFLPWESNRCQVRGRSNETNLPGRLEPTVEYGKVEVVI